MLLQDGETIIRSPLPGDADQLAVLRSSPALLQSLRGRLFPNSLEGPERLLRTQNEGEFPTRLVWTVAKLGGQKEDGVGQVELSRIDWISRTCWFGVWIGPSFQGQGHGYRATRLVCRTALETYGLRQIRLEVLETNKSAIAIYRKLGFEVEGVMSNAATVNRVNENLLIFRLGEP
jgi:RimJ/RimL family protein N-acetyltransferase